MTIIAAVVAGFVALIGFLVNGSLNRAAEKRRICAEALRVVERYAQLPYTYRRRADNQRSTFEGLGLRLADVQIEMAFHKQWLAMEDKTVADAYKKLCRKHEDVNHVYRQQALAAPLVDVEIPRDEQPQFDAEPEWKACRAAMRSHIDRTRLAFWKV